MFKFTTRGGPVSFTLDVPPYGPDLDGVLELQNSAGKTVAIANPANSFGGALTTSLAAGTYYVAVHSSGGYGNLGRYTLHGTIAAATTTPSTPPPPALPPQPLPQDQGEGEGPATPPPATPPPVTPPQPPPSVPTIQIADDGDGAFSSIGTWQKLTGAGYSSDTHWAPAGNSAASTWNFAGLAPGQYRVAATWTGSRLNAADAPFAISSGGKLLATAHVNQQRAASTFTSGGAAWQNLGTFTISGNSLTVRLNSSTGGRVVADAIRLERASMPPAAAAPCARADIVSTADEIDLLPLPDASNFRRPPSLHPAAVDAVLASSIQT